MKFEVSENVDLEEWWAVADGCEYATFFHTPAWAKIFAETYPNMEIAATKFIFDDRVVIFPMMKISQKMGLLDFSTYHSNAPGVYGGWISDKPLTTEQAIGITAWVIKRTKRLIWRINPFNRSLENLNLSEYGEIKEDFTQYLDLNVGYENLRPKFSRGHKNDINRALRKAVKFKIAKTIEDWQGFYQVYLDSVVHNLSSFKVP